MGVDVSVVYDKLGPLTLNVMRRFPSSWYFWESVTELMNDYIVFFMENNFHVKYDEKRLPLHKYLLMGLRNFVIRRMFETKSASTPLNTTGAVDLTLLNDKSVERTPEQIFLGNMLTKSILSILPGEPIGVKIVSIDGTIYSYSHRDIFVLFSEGLSKQEIGRKFGVSGSRIGQLVKECHNLFNEHLSSLESMGDFLSGK